MRLFIAIDINEGIKKALGDLQQQLQKKSGTKKGDAKWVRPDDIHLTLKFLGEVEDEKAAEICNITNEVAARHKSFELKIESVGYFGGRSAKVLWVGTGEGAGNLQALQRELEEQLALAGWPEEAREFTGHLTLCRIRDPKAGMKLAQVTEEYRDFKLGVISADSVVVYKSELLPSGPIYTVLGNYKLQ